MCRNTLSSRTMLVPVFLPFNLIKTSLNTAATLLLYRPRVNALRRARLLPASEAKTGGKINLGVMLAALLLGTLVLIILAYRSVI